MKVLAIDSATPAASVALSDERRLVASTLRVDRRGHSAFMVSAIDFCFDQAGWVPEDLDAIVVDVGPGLYTGLRVGVATAQALAAAIGIPLVPAVSLDAIAYRAATGHRHIWSVVDVRRGEVAVAAYRPVPGGVVKDGPAQVVTPDVFRAMLESDPDDVLAVGDVQALPDGLLRGLHRVKVGRPRYPSADVLLEVAAGALDKGEYPHPDEIRPMYLREPDVTINWSTIRPESPWGAS
ncbi:MAG: tRNA (adenosine(37)-N6)-threonylcarbamoyltransferase complex dimerization subunit type 1 TsaB [Acidimicrobiia bacterium]|nr:tRNA (adenosine(37)-N6)-threonylcarbamoyltransferase complex dimerization subunit type 1 TsaB [Acidimicrobiia bacterium]MDH4306953.1 tRNA (adenosine(37)-N6)-threonylcarbamoyltransferase complex dimerization subunit type 1 TsaB [Acidimicrobiia bacterium]MDH5292277.1 tRNA (adenosine(37)-N6)-threonylcarbamoyltransferase complex dimerization subunit type 1 TsaB [Acidimicrobiia bacterium]